MDEREMTLGQEWLGENPQSWFVSEKMDGCRAYWDGAQFWTRGGNIVRAPASITATLPPCPLDGELWAGRGNFTVARLAVQYGERRFTPAVRFVCFDAPQAAGDWPERMNAAQATGVECVRWWTCNGTEELLRDLRQIVSAGGEGLVIRRPMSPGRYFCGRTSTLLKIKP